MADTRALSTPSAAAIGAAGGAAASILSAQILRLAWLSLLPSFGLTLLYINIHFIGRYLAHSRWFAPFGAEWNPTRVRIGGASAALEYGEIIVFLLADVVVFVLLLMIVTLAYMIVLAMTNYCAMAQQFGVAIATIFAVFAPGSVAGCFVSG